MVTHLSLSSSEDAVLVQISAGTGPREARVFVAALAETLTCLCRARSLEPRACVELGEALAPRSVALELPIEAREVLGGLLGTHELIMPRMRERKGRGRQGERKRWFVGVSLHRLPLVAAPTRDLDALGPRAHGLDPDDLELRFDRAGGPGGQHVNTCSSAVRVVHRPTRLAVRVTSERSQHRNRALAFARLAALLEARAQTERASAHSDRRRAHYRFERGEAVASWRFSNTKPKRLFRA